MLPTNKLIERLEIVVFLDVKEKVQKLLIYYLLPYPPPPPLLLNFHGQSGTAHDLVGHGWFWRAVFQIVRK
jgi:hypothetical protein